METQTCTSHAVTLYFSQEDLNHRGLQLPLAPAEARQLVQSSLLTGGLAPWTAMEIDLFTYGTSLLLVARPAAETAAAFRFETLEDLIQAARLLPRATPAVLLWSDDAFLLLPGILPEPLPRALYESAGTRENAHARRGCFPAPAIFHRLDTVPQEVGAFHFRKNVVY